MKGLRQNGVDRKTAEKLFDLIEKFGGYGFNKSHSVAYALIAYQTAYLKAHYPFSSWQHCYPGMGNQDKTIKNIAECREMGIQIHPPDINQSQSDFSVVDEIDPLRSGGGQKCGSQGRGGGDRREKPKRAVQGLVDFCRRVDGSKVNRSGLWRGSSSAAPLISPPSGGPNYTNP